MKFLNTIIEKRTALFRVITQRVEAISYPGFETTYRSHLRRSRIILYGLKMGPVRCPETSVRIYRYSLRNDPEEHSFYLLSGWGLISRINAMVCLAEVWHVTGHNFSCCYSCVIYSYIYISSYWTPKITSLTTWRFQYSNLPLCVQTHLLHAWTFPEVYTYSPAPDLNTLIILPSSINCTYVQPMGM